jgi:hypothetical protein
MKLNEAVKITKITNSGDALDVLQGMQNDLQNLYKFMKKDYRFKDKTTGLAKAEVGIKHLIWSMKQADQDDAKDHDDHGGKWR